MTNLYYVRHARPNYENHVDELRELCPEGLRERRYVTEYLKDQNIQAVYSSPFLRAIQTIEPFADEAHLEIQRKEELCERKVGPSWIKDFHEFAKHQWSDFSFRLDEGECLKEVQERNVSCLQVLLKKHKNQNFVIAGHGTALSTIINYYDLTFGFKEFLQIKDCMPLVVHFTFQEEQCTGYEFIQF